ncbi:MAG: sulfite exporter TauE/SafE family protein [Chloroflexi bacterium]|nr:sulfite exporter TauE/SafE family protein [Chloroflexota bacterium]
MLTPAELIFAAITIFVGATIFSTVGFGIGVTTIPVLLLVFDPQTVVVVVNGVSLPMFCLVIYQTRRHVNFREMVPISFAGFWGIPVGVFFLSSANVSLLRISTATLIILLTLLVAFNVRWAMPRNRAAGMWIGFAAGVMLTASGVGGALMVLAMLAKDLQRQALRGSLALYFLAVEGVAVAGYGVAGLYTTERIVLTLAVTVPVILGFVLATAIGRRMNERVFRRLVIGTVIVTSLVVLAREISGFLA